MSNQVTKAGTKLPAVPDFIRNLPKTGSNADVRDGLSSGISAPPRISIEGGVFRVVKEGVSRPLVRVVDGVEEAIQSLNVVVLRSNKGKYKVFYGKKYDPDAEAEAPQCYSYDGITPSTFANEPQSATCAACPHNAWGSAITENGKKTRACSDNKILAVMPLSAVQAQADSASVEGQVYSLKVSPSALSRNREDRNANPQNNVSLQEYVALLDAFPSQEGEVEVPLTAVATRLFFEIDAQYPLLRFRLSRFLNEEEVAYVESRIEGEDVARIVTEQGQGPVPTRAPLPAPAAVAPKAIAAPVETPQEPDQDEEDPFAPPPPKKVAKAPEKAPPARAKPGPKPRERVKVEETGTAVDAAIANLGSLFAD